jgi:hypothetical protein
VRRLEHWIAKRFCWQVVRSYAAEAGINTKQEAELQIEECRQAGRRIELHAVTPTPWHLPKRAAR